MHLFTLAFLRNSSLSSMGIISEEDNRSQLTMGKAAVTGRSSPSTCDFERKHRVAKRPNDASSRSLKQQFDPDLQDPHSGARRDERAGARCSDGHVRWHGELRMVEDVERFEA